MSAKSVRLLHVGLGPIGCAVLRVAAAREGLKVVGGVDIDAAKADHDLGDVAGLGRRLGVKVRADLDDALRALRPDVVIHCTGSSLKRVGPELQAILRRRVPIVSTTEELAYPFYTQVRLGRQVDGWARRARVAIAATGVNPGFAMDALPITFTAACERVDRVSVTRIQDARLRRLPFQQKIGAGLTTEQFARRVRQGLVRHVGFAESIAMIADALGWGLDRITDDVQPKIAAVTVASDHLAVDPGYVCGIVQTGIGYRNRHPVIRLYMEAYLGAPESYDAIDIEGVPPLSVRIPGGIHGDIATAAIVVNTIPGVLAAEPGLHTMRDLPLPSFFPGLAGTR
jgi:4-hydroxy-tetrahydrodipicolinate reductase